MLGVPSAPAATIAALFAAGFVLVGVCAFAERRRLLALRGIESVVAIAVIASLVSAPLLGWRFVKDLRYTTSLDAYDRANAGPIQAYLPGYLVARAQSTIPPGGTWATRTGRVSNSIASAAFSPLVLVTLFPRVSADPSAAGWILTLGALPGSVAPVSRTYLLRPAVSALPAARLGKAAR
ncbi:MAG TPA: hypothetical protein VHC67_10115 [Gaiellaceae bacterium]|jgi:hypothetical protein|nr:hypothetical protein [Gaiellaceae bacterium]